MALRPKQPIPQPPSQKKICWFEKVGVYLSYEKQAGDCNEEGP